MLFSLSFVFVTALALQNPSPQTANGFRAPHDNVPPNPARTLSPEIRGDIFMARKMYREAIDTYREGPKDSAVLTNKIGIAYHQLLDLESAKKQYERAAKLNPKYAEAINNLGTIYYARKSYRRAIGQYKRALRVMPNTAAFMFNLGTADFARKDYKEAARLFEEARKIDPMVFENHGSVGTTLQEGTVEERAKLHYYFAKTYAKAGETELALQYIRKSLEEGFKDRAKFHTDPEFAKLQDNPDFKLLLATEQRVL
jgi:tetratricopeptide (TPR) repeat protein